MSANDNLSLLFSIIIFHCAIMLARGEEVFTIKDYYKLRGEKFCETRKNGFIFENICHEIAKENGLQNYEAKYLSANCTDRTISIFDNKKYDFVKEKEILLTCEYNRNKGSHVTRLAKKAIGIGKEETDVMDYDVDRGIATPYRNQTGLLNKVHVITLEQFAVLKGKDFCSLKKFSDFLRLMCENIARKNNIADYSDIRVDNTCQKNIKISIYFRTKRENVDIKPELLLCTYIRDNVTVVASRALGKGKEENDVMEYTVNGDVAQPRINQPDLLSEIHVLTSEQHKLLAGEEFCTTRKDNAEALKNLCTKVAFANGYETYMRDMLDASCEDTSLALFSEDEKKWVQIEENLLHCTYKKQSNKPIEGHEPVFKRFASKALGKGRGKNDVMEYNYSQSKFLAMPFSNRVDFLIDKI